MKKRVKKLKANGTFASKEERRLSSLDANLQAEVRQTEEILDYLRSYNGQHAVLVDFKNKMAKPGWVPSAKDRGLFLAVMRRQKAGKGFARETDPLAFAISLDIDTRPSSLEA